MPRHVTRQYQQDHHAKHRRGKSEARSATAELGSQRTDMTMPQLLVQVTDKAT